MADPQAIAAALARAGVRVLFGVPGGGSNLEVIGACAAEGVAFALVHGETSGVIAAAVHGEATGTLGAALCTRGPGLAAAANGIAQAQLDRQPVVVVTDGTGHGSTHQRLDHAALGATVAKAVVTDPEAAVRLALAPPWGAVVLDVGGPREAVGSWPAAAVAPTPAPALPAHRRALLVAGVGARGAEAAVRRLAAASGAPVLETYRGKGTLPHDDASLAGLLTGGTLEAPLLEEADLVVLLGVDPIELVPGPWHGTAPVVALGPWIADDVRIPLAASAAGPLAELLDGLVLDASGWSRAGAAFRAEAHARLRAGVTGFGPHAAVDAIARALPPGARTTVDAGAHMLVAMPFLLAAAPGDCRISSGLATMGFALPAAIGAALADSRPVVCVTGDGGLGMCLAELETVARLGLDVRVVVLDDATLSLIAIKQRPGQGGAGAVRYDDVDLAAIARAAGLAATTVDDAAALARALATPGPSLVRARIDPTAYAGVLEATRGARR